MSSPVALLTQVIKKTITAKKKWIIIFHSPRGSQAGNKPPAKTTVTRDLDVSAINCALLSQKERKTPFPCSREASAVSDETPVSCSKVSSLAWWLPLKTRVRASLSLSFAQERRRGFFVCPLDMPTFNGEFCFALFVPDKTGNVIFSPCSRQVTREGAWLVLCCDLVSLWAALGRSGSLWFGRAWTEPVILGQECV